MLNKLQMTILLVDDEPALTQPLSRLLTREGYTVDVATDGRVGSELASQGNYNLLILDWMLPHLTGLQICQQLRDRGDLTPVLFLTAKDTLNDRVIGLDAGADDYLVKPFELRELLARVRALLRRVQTIDPTPTRSKLHVDDLELDLDNQLAHIQWAKYRTLGKRNSAPRLSDATCRTSPDSQPNSSTSLGAAYRA